jgi:RimJ/RimL family protein N-acetyltransferase
MIINNMNASLKLNSERLTLRPITLDDSKEILHYRSDSETNKYQGWIPKNIDDVNDFIKNKVSPIIDKNGTWFQLVIIRNQNGKLIGDIGLHFFDNENKQVEIGCTLSKDYHGKGYATEALFKVIDYLFNTLQKHRVIASIDPRNKDSIKLFNRLNFRQEAHFKESILVNNEWTDDAIYAILKSEWSHNN